MKIRYILLLLTVASLLGSCAAPKVAYFTDLKPGMAEQVLNPLEIRVRPEDKISILVNSKDPLLMDLFNLPIISRQIGIRSEASNNQGMSGYTINKDGNIDFPVLGHIHVAGMTREEIEAYGLHFQEELFTEPFITDWVLDRMFGERAAMVRDTYLEPAHDGRYRMKPEYDTQRKVEAAFEGKTDKADTDLRDGLYALISDVLFVRDHRDPNKFHPRMSVQFDFIYESLYDSDKFLFNKIYNDYYYRRNNQFWYREAMNKLPKLVEATRMLVCAEDLGMVPDCVQWVMNELKILSLELQSMPKDPSVRFGVLSRNPYRSVCTISSHDTPTLRQWWDEDASRTQDYYNNVLQKYGAAPHPLPGWLARDIISRHLLCPSMLCILTVQDWLAVDESIRLADANAERINIPSNPRHYWRYRMHMCIEDLMEAHDYNQNITDLIKESGRM